MAPFGPVLRRASYLISGFVSSSQPRVRRIPNGSELCIQTELFLLQFDEQCLKVSSPWATTAYQ